MELTTLIYITCEDHCLFIRKTKPGDINCDKWLGIGGHFENTESPEECVMRELKEETGFTAKDIFDFRFRGLVTFVSDGEYTEYMHVFTARAKTLYLPQIHCDEGDLVWVDMKDIRNLPVWAGDLRMFDLLFANPEDTFFSLKLEYRGDMLTSTDVNEYSFK